MKVISNTKTEKYEELVVEDTWFLFFKRRSTYRRYTEKDGAKRTSTFQYYGDNNFRELGMFEHYLIADLFRVIL
jgi:hypothetical protein